MILLQTISTHVIMRHLHHLIARIIVERYQPEPIIDSLNIDDHVNELETLYEAVRKSAIIDKFTISAVCEVVSGVVTVSTN